MIKKIFFAFILCFLSFFTLSQAFAVSEVNFFEKPGCQFCQEEDAFLKTLETKYGKQLQINAFSILNQDNVDKLKALCEQNKIEKCLGVVPVTFVGDKFFLGFDEGIGSRIENAIRTDLGLSELSTTSDTYVPILGKIDLSKYSLPALAIILGFFDGFNVCSLGALVLILSLVLALKSRKRILIFGGTFIITTAIIYGVLIFLWYKVFSVFENYLGALQILIGLASLIGGIYFLKQFIDFRKKGPACDMADKGISGKLSKHVSNSFQKSLGIFALMGTILLFALVITIVEFPCSAALPLVFTGTLTHAGVSTGMHLVYIAIYLLFYLLDELVVFIIATVTMKIWISSSKFIIWSALAASIFLFLMSGYYFLGMIK
jgi:hypothetical protein